MVWHATPRRAAIEALRAKVTPHHERYADGVALVVAARGGPPDDEARTAFREMVRSVEKSIAGVAVLVGVRGFRGAVVRGAVSAAVLALGLPFGVKVLDSPATIGDHVDRLLRDRRLDSPGARSIERALAAIESPVTAA